MHYSNKENMQVRNRFKSDNVNIDDFTHEKEEVLNNNLSITEQEKFMHLLYDVVHVGVSVISLEFILDDFDRTYEIKLILNTKMKNEKYSDEYEYPIYKVLYQQMNFIENDFNAFFNRKLEVLKLLVKYGASIKHIFDKLDLIYLKNKNRINDEIIKYIESMIQTTN
jgi:hypothetical protein